MHFLTVDLANPALLLIQRNLPRDNESRQLLSEHWLSLLVNKESSGDQIYALTTPTLARCYSFHARTLAYFYLRMLLSTLARYHALTLS